MKVFLSHSTKDKEFVARLAAALEGAHFEPWLCEVDIEKNENFVAKIEEGLSGCDVSLVVWSPDSAASVWTKEEWTSILARQVSEQRVRLGIVLLREHPLPELLRTSNYIDARTNQEEGLRETVKWLQRREVVQRLSGLHAPVYLPDYRPKDFVGRAAYLERLQQMLVSQPGTFLLHGEPGTGKSLLALSFAWDSQKDFDAVIYQSCGARKVDEITEELADKLAFTGKTLSVGEKRRNCLQWLRGRQSLLVLDDVWNLDVKQLEPGPPCSVLYTSRFRSLPWISADQSLEVEKFTETEADQLFQDYLVPTFGEQELAQCHEVLLEFARKVEMLPIALAAAASLLRSKAASRLERSILKLRLDELNDGIRDVPHLLQTAIAAQPEPEQRLLTAASVCAQEGFWLPLAARIAGLAEDNAEDAADILVNSALLRVLNRGGQRFQLHALLREEVRARRTAGALARLQQDHADALLDLSARWKEQTPLQFIEELGLARTFLEAEGKLENSLALVRKEEAMWVELKRGNWLELNYCGQAQLLNQLQRPEDALQMLIRQEELCLELNNKEGLVLGYAEQAYTLLALNRHGEGLEKAIKQGKLAHEIGNGPGLLLSYRVQAYILYSLDRWDEALQIMREEEQICIELSNRAQLAQCYFLWGEGCCEHGDLLTGQQKLRDALAIFEELNMPAERQAVQEMLDEDASS